jgi:hypothetical protein
MTDSQSLLGQIVSNYRALEKLGRSVNLDRRCFRLLARPAVFFD